MFTTTKKLAITSIILTVVNAVATVLFFLFFAGSKLGFSLTFTCVLYLSTATLISLLMSIALSSLCRDLDFKEEYDAQTIRKLSNRIKVLESKTNH